MHRSLVFAAVAVLGILVAHSGVAAQADPLEEIRYRTLRLGEPDVVARADLLKIWNPFTDERFPQWLAFLEAARSR